MTPRIRIKEVRNWSTNKDEPCLVIEVGEYDSYIRLADLAKALAPFLKANVEDNGYIYAEEYDFTPPLIDVTEVPSGRDDLLYAIGCPKSTTGHKFRVGQGKLVCQYCSLVKIIPIDRFKSQKNTKICHGCGNRYPKNNKACPTCKPKGT